MRQIFFTSIFFLIVIFGVGIPVVAAAGYIWVDLVTPQKYLFTPLRSLPISAICGGVAMGMYILIDRKSPPRPGGLLILLSLFAIWVTLTCFWAALPAVVWEKWDWAFKSVAFGIFMPFVFRTRLQIELCLLAISFSVASHYLNGGVYSLLGGASYGSMTEGNSGLSESSTLALVSVMLIPITIFLMQNSIIFKKTWHRTIIFGNLILFQALTAIGSFARTGLVALAVLFFTQLYYRRAARMRTLLVAAILMAALAPVMSDVWLDRMSTIRTYDEDGSAMGRILVWAWTLDYVKEHPLGGGFLAYKVSSIEEPNGEIREGVAFHNMFIEVLGEHGYPGLIIFSLLFYFSIRKLQNIRKSSTQNTDQKYFHEISTAIICCLIVYIVGGQFIGIAFQPFTYYFIGLTISLENCYARYRLQGQLASGPSVNRYTPTST